MGYVHDHGNDFNGQWVSRRLAVALALAATTMLAEVAGGILANSLALLADATHMLSDVAALALSLFAARVARRPPTVRRTFGHRRVEVLASMVNGAALLATAAIILIEALRRFAAPPQVNGLLMTAVAAGGLLVNLAMLAVLHRSRGANLNVRGAWLHVLTDTLGSVQAIAAGALLLAFGWRWVDPAASLAISALVLYSGWGLLRETLGILMESVPDGIDLDEVRSAILAVPGVAGVHDLHVWTISTGFVAMSAHVTLAAAETADALAAVRETLSRRYRIDHSTIQIEPTATARCDGGAGCCSRGEP